MFIKIIQITRNRIVNRSSSNFHTPKSVCLQHLSELDLQQQASHEKMNTSRESKKKLGETIRYIHDALSLPHLAFDLNKERNLKILDRTSSTTKKNYQNSTENQIEKSRPSNYVKYLLNSNERTRTLDYCSKT